MSIFSRLSFGNKTPHTHTPPPPAEMSFDYFANAAKYNRAIPREHYNGRYIIFGDDNLAPNRLNELYDSSAIHSAIIDLKKTMICGGGYTIEPFNPTNGYEAVAIKQIEREAEEDTTLKDFIENITQDYLIHSTVYIKLTWNEDKSKLISFKRYEPSTMRLGVNMSEPEIISRYFYSFDWADTGRFRITELAPRSRTNKEKVEVWRIIKKSPACKWYTYPQYGSAGNWIQLDSLVSLYHKSNIENSTNPGRIITFPTKPPTPEAKREIINRFNQTNTGPTTTGKSYLFFVDGKDNAPIVQTLEPTSMDKQFEVTEQQAIVNICTAHKMSPIILGLKSNSSLGNPQDLLNAFEMFRKTVVNPARMDIELIVQQLFQMMGVKANITINDFELELDKLPETKTAQ